MPKITIDVYPSHQSMASSANCKRGLPQSAMDTGSHRHANTRSVRDSVCILGCCLVNIMRLPAHDVNKPIAAMLPNGIPKANSRPRMGVAKISGKKQIKAIKISM